MPMYPKTTGDCVTVKIKNASQANGGRMLLDNQLAEMIDIMLPVGELKTFATDEVDAWISKMAAYNQVWAEPDGSLLKKSDYPALFALIGYNYGWSNSNPNGTYTHTFTDVDGNEKSLVLYNDLDIDGNAKPVSGSPAYFRLPNFAGRFLRCKGTATYANKWTDTDGNEHEVLTEYKAEMYKGKLDAQRDITGNLAAICNGGPGGTAIWNQLQTVTNGAFYFKDDVRKEYRAKTDYNPNEAKAPIIASLESSKTTPSNQEVVSSFLTIKQLLRIA